MIKNDHNNSGVESSQFDNFETSVSGVDNVTKKGKGKKAALIGGISAAVVVGGAATAYAASDTVKNQVKLRLSKPEKYYAWVTEKNSKSIAETVSEYYQKSLDNYEKGQSSNIKLSFEPSQELRDYLADELLPGCDETTAGIIKDNDSFALDMNAKIKKGNTNSNIGLDVSGKRIADVEISLDTSAMEYFMRIPQLKEQWIGISSADSETLSDLGLSEMMNVYKDILKDPASFMSPDELEEEINRYVGVWSNFADDVKLEKKESVDICDINVNYTVATVDVKVKDAQKLALDFAKELEDDKIIKGIVVDKLKVVDESEYNKAISDLKNTLSETDDNEVEDELLVSVDTYIDATGTIRGLSFSDEFDDKALFIVGKDGDNIRGEFTAYTNGEVDFSVKLNAVEEKKSYSGDITLTYSDYDYEYDDEASEYTKKTTEKAISLIFSGFEITDEEKGYFNGDISLEIPDTDPINISFSGDDDKEVISYDLRVGGYDGKLSLSYAVDFGATPDILSKGDAFMLDIENIEDTDPEDYVSREEFSGFLKKVFSDLGAEGDDVDSAVEDITDDIFDGYSNVVIEDNDEFDFDDDDDSDFDFDDEDFSFEFNRDDYKYEDFKDFMTEEDFEDWLDEMEEYSKQAE